MSKRHARKSPAIGHGLEPDSEARATPPPAGAVLDVRHGTDEWVERALALTPHPALVAWHGRVLAANQQFARLLGAEDDAAGKDRFIGADLRALIDQDLYAEFGARLQRVLEADAATDFVEFKIRRVTGEDLHVEGVATPVEWDGHHTVFLIMRDITGRKQAEDYLRERDEILDLILNGVADANIIHVADRIVFANRAAADMFGYATVADMLGDSVIALHDPSEWSRVRQYREGLKDFGARQTAPDVAFRRADGRTFSAEVIGTAVRWKGTPATLIAIRDLTNRRALAKALKDSQECFDGIPGMLAQRVLTPDGRLVFTVVSAGVRDLLDLDPEDVKKRPALAFDRIHPDDQRAFRAAVAQSSVSLEPYSIDFRWWHPSGAVLWLRQRAKPRRRDDGAIVWDVLTTDVTAEKRAEEAQRESEERLRTVAGNLPGFLFECFIDRREDIRLRFLSAGHFEIGRRFGADAESSGVTLLDLVHPDDRQSVRQVALDAARTRSPWECTFRSVISGAEECWLRALAQPRSTEDGHLVWDGLALDETVRVTEARRNEQLQAKLRQGEKMESLGTLAGGVAHELNNLLQPITMMTEMVLENLPEASREAAQLRRVVDASGKAAEIVGRILSFGRAEDVTYRSLDIGEVVREAAAFMRAMLPRSITLHVDVAAEVGRIRGNRTQLTQVLMNMATNARDAIGANVGGIWIGLERADLPDPAPTANIGSLRAAPYAAISVRDDGCGMDRETMRRMFEPFFTTKDVGKGTGLGLSVTHGIIIGHDGAIRVESTPGKGTAFTIYLPLGSRNGATQTEGD